jgi:hypothetical protein
MITTVAYATFAQEKVLKEMDAVKIDKNSVPASVSSQATKDFQNASPYQFYSVGETSLSKDWKVSEEVDIQKSDKFDHYVVELKGKDSYFHALYDSKGKLLMSREWQKDVALPAPVSAAITKAYPGVGLTKDEHSKVVDKGKSKEYYVVTLSTGKKVTALPDGTLVKK